MKKYFNKIMALAMAALLLVSSAGCGKEKTADTEKTSQSTASTVQQETTVKKEPVKITIGSPTLKGLDLAGVQNDDVAKEIERVLGITVNIDTNIDDAKDKILTATGDLPDIYIGVKDKLLNMVKAGYIIELDQLLESNGSDIKKNIPKAIDFMRKYWSNDTGKLYAIPGKVNPGTPMALINPYLRWDYYTELGKPAINSHDDLVNVVEAMIKKHPTNDQGKPYYGFSMDFTSNIWGYGIFGGYMFTGKQSTDQFVEYNVKDNSWTDMINNPDSSLWAGAKFWNKANRKKLLDPDTFVQKTDTLGEKYKADRILCPLGNWWANDANAALKSDGKDNKWYLPVPQTDGYMIAGFVEPVGSSGYWWTISKNCKNPDRAMELINYCFSIEGTMTLINGVKGKHWDLVDGKYTYTEEFVNMKNTDKDYVKKTGAGKWGGMMGLQGSWKTPDTDQYLDLSLDPTNVTKTYNEAQKNYCQEFGFGTINDVPTKSKGYLYNTFAPMFVPETPTDMKRIEEKLMNYVKTNLPKLVLKPKTDDEFEAMRLKMIEEMKKMDLDNFMEYWNKTYADAMAKEAAVGK